MQNFYYLSFIFTIFFIVPSQPPNSVNVNSTSGFTVIVDWVHISQEYWNGRPVGTLIKYDNTQGHNGSVSIIYPQSSIILSHLVPVSTYVIDVCEMTSPGVGPCQRVQASTLPSRKCLKIILP